MQFALQDLRKWGYKKIYQKFVSTSSSRRHFLEGLYQLSSNLYDIKCSAYSLPKKLAKFTNEDDIVSYKGMHKFISSCEPMVDSMEISTTLQRKFRNQWGSVWKNVAKDLEFSEKEEQMLSDVGIKICFVEDLNYIDEDILMFFNSILIWSVFISSENNIESSELSPLDIIDILVTSSCDEFISLLNLL